jgi:hygromycin-B 7''-O-kinase
MRPQISSADEYAALFSDAAYWRPYVATICARHALSAAPAIETGLAGTNPVFLIDQRYVVKLYSPFFNGGDSFVRERAAYALLQQRADLPTPQLIAQGQLFDDDWRWPYIIVSAIAGESYGAAEAQLADDDRERIAGWLGATCRQLHALPLDGRGPLQPSWDAFAAFMAQRRASCIADQRRWRTLPDHLIDQIEAYLPPLDELIDRTGAPCLLHADLNADHLLGQRRADGWQPSGVIDFGDARSGDPHYELLALHLGLFRGDKRLLQRYLMSYGGQSEPPDRFVRRAMSYTLLHEFNILAAIRSRLDTAPPLRDLDQLARLVWAIDEPKM